MPLAGGAVAVLVLLIAVLLDKRVVVGTMEELLVYDHPWVKEYFHGPRGRAARQEQK